MFYFRKLQIDASSVDSHLLEANFLKQETSPTFTKVKKSLMNVPLIEIV